MTSTPTLREMGYITCEICDNVTPTIYCPDCAETVCEYCHDAYPEDYCG